MDDPSEHIWVNEGGFYEFYRAGGVPMPALFDELLRAFHAGYASKTTPAARATRM